MERVVLCMIDEQTPPAVCELGADLASRLGLPLELLHVARDPSPSRFGPGPERERARHRAVGQGEELLGRFGGLAPAGTECRVELGEAISVTLSRATDAALVVVGSRGRGAVAGALFGSFSREVAREAPCPVVVVPPGAVGGDGWLDESREGSSSVVYGIADGESSADGLRVAAVLAAALGDRLVVVQEDGAGEEMLDDLSPEVERVDYDGALAPGLEAIAEAERARLVAVSGSVGGLARHARAPLMVVPGGLEPGGLSAALGLARAG